MKRLVLMFAVSLVTLFAWAQGGAGFQLSSHILDINKGIPAPGVKIALSKMEESGWVTIDEKFTDKDGRVKDFLKKDGTDHTGVYKLTYYTAPYFEKLHQETFYPYIEVVFEIKDDKHYHVPITLSPFGYSTYRGS